MKIYTTHTFYCQYGDEARRMIHEFDTKMESDGWQRAWASIEMDHQFVVYVKKIESAD